MSALRAEDPKYTFTASLPLREVLEEVRRMNDGKAKQAYLRFRVHLFTFQYRKLLEGKERELAKAAIGGAQEFGGRVVKVAFTSYSLEIDYLCPAAVGCEKANRLLARRTSIYFKEHFRGIGGAQDNGFLWNKVFATYTMDSPLLERPHEFETL
jgi:hypothetical protein